MPYDVLQAIDAKERLNFSQNFAVTRPTVLDRIFPDVKTSYWNAEFYRLMNGATLPDVAFVHALDTEAEIGSRVGFDKVEVEKLFIKRKINQSERLQQAIEHGVPDNDALTKFVFDDASNLFEGVLARTKIMKAQVLSAGSITINENNVNMNIDFKLPSQNKISFGDWSDPDYDIMGDIENAVDVAKNAGFVLNTMVTSRNNINCMRKNKGMQLAALGANNARLLTKQELANLIAQEYNNMVIEECEEQFRYKKADGTFATGRYFADNKVSFFEANADGSLGTGLWGPTPEENEYRQFIENENRSFITLSMWATPDPVAKWTKASGMFVPVSPKTNSIVIGTVSKNH